MRYRSLVYAVIVLLISVVLACSGGRAGSTETPAATATAEAMPKSTEAPETEEAPATEAEPTASPTAPPATDEPIGGYRQWAVDAVASSEYSNPSWSARQAIGSPDTPVCEDRETAWAALESNTIEWIELSYDVPVMPTQVNIIQTLNPNQVAKVELIDLTSGYHEVYNGQPEATDACPYTLSIAIKDADYQVMGLRITIDQSLLELGWNEIDAVELVGQADRPMIPEPTSSATVAWRTDGDLEGSGSVFSELRGLDATAGQVFVADAYNGVYVFDADGTFAGQIGAGEAGSVVDVKVAASGRVYIADAGLHQVTMLSDDWELLGGFGAEGSGDGEFGPNSPVALAIRPNGELYLLDANTDGVGGDSVRVQVFDADGGFLRSFPLEDPSARAMDFGPDANLYVACTSGVILGIDPDDGEGVVRLGEEALASALPQMLSIDDAGNFYVTTQIPAGAVKLDREGRLLETIGVETVRTEEGWPEGEFLFPVGIAVSPDASRLYIGDTYVNFSYVTAFSAP